MRIPILLFFLSVAWVVADAGFEDRRTVAEEAYARRSFSEVARVYQLALEQLTLKDDDRRWAEFRIADATWRAQSAAGQMDPTAFQQSREKLEAMVRDDVRDGAEDRTRAEIRESIGDSYLTRNEMNTGMAWSWYEQALDFWAGQTELEPARARYLGMIRKSSMREEVGAFPYGMTVPLVMLEKAATIALSPEDRAWTHYLLALAGRHQHLGPDPNRVRDAFTTAIEHGRNTKWYDDALFQFAQWTESSGSSRFTEEGEWILEPDFPGALTLYRRILREFDRGESRYREVAQQRIDELTGASVALIVDQFFLPGSEVGFHATARNVKRVEYALYPVQLSRAVELSGRKDMDWLQSIDVKGLKPVHKWRKDIEDDGRHRPTSFVEHVSTPLAQGAYLLHARAGGKDARELLLVTDSALAIKTGGGQLLAWFCRAMDGTPNAGTSVAIWQQYHDQQSMHWERVDAVTDSNGVATVALRAHTQQILAFAGSATGGQAFATGYAGFARHPDGGTSWRIQAFTDRPAYRPGDTIYWKCHARMYDGASYSTPVDQTLEIRVQDPRGQPILTTNAALNRFGSAWGILDVNASMPLGLYTVIFQSEGRHVGSATLFRLEEYKLPEFQVTVSTPVENGRAKSFLLGERIEAEIRADYYSGGAVAGAKVDVVIRKRVHHRVWCAPMEFGWLQPRAQNRIPFHAGEEIVRQEQVQTDAEGRARITIETDPSGPELEYTVEARVTDASRREVVGSGRIRVGEQRYFIEATPDRRIGKPGRAFEVEIRAMDPLDLPVSVTGKLQVSRLAWRERWIDPLGQPFEGEALRAARAGTAIWPPLPPPNRPPWQCVTNGYEEEELRLDPVIVPTSGVARYAFTPSKTGYHLLRWRSPQAGGRPIRAEIPCWITTEDEVDVGYRNLGGVELIVDRDTFRPGETAGVMLVTPESGRHVLFTVEGERLLSHRVDYLPGHSRWIPIPVDETHVPNIHLTASCFSDATFSTDNASVVVPPVRHYLNVTVQTERVAYQPREEASLRVRVTDYKGQPVKAEIALGLSDEAVQYIQSDLAEDPRAFYFGSLRPHGVSTWHSFNQKRLARFRTAEEGVMDDELDIATASDGFGLLQNKSMGTRRNAMAGRRMVAGGMPVAAESAAMPMMAMAAADGAVAKTMESTGLGGAAGDSVVVRTDFRATAFWQPDLVTDASGEATVKTPLPDTLTRWQAKARVLTEGNAFGIASNAFESRLPVMCRLQTPRFLVVGDTCTVRAVVQNQTDEALELTHRLQVEGLELRGPSAQRKAVPARGEVSIDWTAIARTPGTARVIAQSQGEGQGDAMERTMTVADHGLEVFLGLSTRSTGAVAAMSFVLPKERRASTTTLELRVTPSIAASLLDALPYLAEYPYGCTEQTMSRFLPAVVVARTLRELGWDAAAVARRMPSIQTDHPSIRTNALDRLDVMVNAGLERLYDFQHDDGSWGWWKEGDADPYMTAYVVWGLALARDAGIHIRTDAAKRGITWLEQHLVDAESSPDLLAWSLHALTAHTHDSARIRKAADGLWEIRDALTAQGRAHFLLALVHLGPADRVATLAENLRDGVFRDDSPAESLLGGGSGIGLPTARWGASGFWWRWSDSPIESTAFALKALLAAKPDDDLIDPAMHWLVRNRRGNGWSNTRDTAYALLALSDYLLKRKEVRADLRYRIELNGQSAGSGNVPGDRVLESPDPIRIDPSQLRDGTNELRIVREEGQGSIYAQAGLRFFSEEEPVQARGHELFVKHQYYRLHPKPTLLKGVRLEREPLDDQDAIRSGDRIEVVITVETKNDYAYLLLEDLKPAGFESVEVKSGNRLQARHLTGPAGQRRFAAGLHDVDPSDYTGRAASLYPEFRDRTVALFADRLDQGLWEIRYELRAETPGYFHALPLTGHAMYAPDIRANGTEIRVEVKP